MLLKFSDRFPVYDAANFPSGWLDTFLREEAKHLLNGQGALLIRNAPIDTPQQLEHYARILIASPMAAYIGGVVPRASHSKYVFSSTELTALFKLKLHNEMAYQANYPRYITFYCDTPPSVLGETPIAHQAEIQQNLPSSLRDTIMNDDVVYVRRYLSREFNRAKVARLRSMFVPWQDSFKTENKAQVEAHCRDIKATFDWGVEDTLTVRTVLPASRIHPDTGERVYFNQLLTQNFSVYGLGPAGFISHRLAGISRDSAPRDSHLAANGALTRHDWSALSAAYSKSTRAFKWKKHDWMLIDNLQVMHARNRFLGKRAIWVAMGN